MSLPLAARRRMLATAVVLATAVSVPAGAATYQLSFTSGSGDTASLQVSLTGSIATAITGTIDGSVVTGLSPYAGADQQLFPTATVHFTVPGLSFSAANGVLYNLTSYPSNSDRITNSSVDPLGYGTPTPAQLTSFSISPVPLPATVCCLAAALAGLAATGSRRRAKVLTS